MRNFLAISVVCGLIGLATTGAQATNLQVLYAFDRTTAQAHQEIKERFEKENPGITVEFLAAAQNYEDASQSIIRSAMIGDLPDLTFQGLNLARGLVDRGIAVPLDPFIAGDGGADKLGYDAGMLRAGSVNGTTFGIPFAVSTPLIYVNADLVRAAGGTIDAFPTRWDDIVALGKKIDDPARNITGFYFQWDITGNWMFQSLLFANGGSMMSPDEKAITFDQPPGRAALETLELFAKAKMPNLPSSQARPASIAGRIGIFADSSSNLGVILSKDPEKQAAAWKYIKFATGPVGQTIMARHTGYLPSNSIAVNTPELLGDFYKANASFQASIAQVPILTGWYAFPGPNAVKIIDVIKRHTEAVVTGRKSAAETMPAMATDVRKLLE
jgi:multiple sugar transport system substrate-binding protein